MADLRTVVGALALRNPILSASGTFGHGLEMVHFVPPRALGGLVSKTVTLEPRHGNSAPRIRETEAGFLNSIGLENHGIEAYLRDTLPAMEAADTCVVTNIGGESAEDFARAASLLAGFERIDALEVNLSCPNVDGGRLPFATDPRVAEEVIASVRATTDKPIWAKLSPNVTRIADIALAVEAGGADAVTAGNTLLGMQIDWRSGATGLATRVGGYSGIGIKPIALRCAWECVQALSIPVIGCGGITTASDVLEFLAAGCHAIQVGTASFSDPGLLGRLGAEVDALLEREGIARITEVIGRVDRGVFAETRR